MRISGKFCSMNKCSSFSFTLINDFENQFQGISKADELNNQKDEFGQPKCGHKMNSVTKVLLKCLDAVI